MFKVLELWCWKLSVVERTPTIFILNIHFVALKTAINNEKNKFKEKVRERNTKFTWFDKLSTSTGERADVIIIVYHRVTIVDYLY